MTDTAPRPNIIFIIMDDMAYGDLACHGNPYTRTPHLDALYSGGTRLERHCSGPLCSPARASIMTGRYHMRTRVIDTYNGRSMMDPSEVTLAQSLKEAGYHTGLFGKWHLGDNAPNRPQDMGFDEVLMHKGGGIGQPGDHLNNHGRDSYFDPWLYHNGDAIPYEGYCTDIFAEATMDFIKAKRKAPFFAYLATNAPHSPFQIDEKWVSPYREHDLPDKHAKVYGMNENIDWNVGRIMQTLKDEGLIDNTLVIFTSDHGPCNSATAHDEPKERQVRFNCNLRDIKGSMYEGGIKVPSLWHWPARVKAGVDITTPTHAIDIMPTLLHLAGATASSDMDGENLSPMIQAGENDDTLAARHLFMQWHRGDVPVAHRNCAVIQGNYKLVRELETQNDALYDLAQDPTESTDIANQHSQRVATLCQAYEAWFNDVSHTRENNYAAPPILVGSPHQAITELSRQDWRLSSPIEGWDDRCYGHWDIDVAKDGEYAIDIFFSTNKKSATPRSVYLKTFHHIHTAVLQDATAVSLDTITLNKGTKTIEAWAADYGGIIPALQITVSPANSAP